MELRMRYRALWTGRKAAGISEAAWMFAYVLCKSLAKFLGDIVFLVKMGCDL
tara:strand:+ start:2030 stop:2185 length:156 start_codon:yes stop_codon:yes gene_type:complete